MPKKLPDQLPYDLEPNENWPPPDMTPFPVQERFRKPAQPPPQEQYHHRSRWLVPILVLLAGLFLMLVLIAVADLTRGDNGMVGSSDPTPAHDPPGPSIDMGKVSVDTIREDLIRHGFKVDPLDITTDEQFLAYEAADTHIDGIEAGILTFSDRETTKDWVELSDAFHGIAVVGDDWAISIDSDRKDLKAEQLADRIAKEIGADAQYR